MRPNEIEAESFRIILEELGEHSFSPQELSIVQRVIHATADFEYADLLAFSPTAIADGVRALRSGSKVLTDVQMTAVGISQARLSQFSASVRCAIQEAETTSLAHSLGATRSTAAIRRMSADLDGAIAAIGNAPTALFELLRLAKEEGLRPVLVVGTPVGFVNAAESKAALRESGLPYITVRGRKGGSTVAAAIVNALLKLALAESNA
ncbi:MAG: precorrin-8X methylmutase [Chloroflexi bacterium]|nr:precorrin-8X methylmutase [Chloroflexota bacterium]